MIHVCFCLHDKDGRYSKFTGTTITSVFENTTSEVTVHLLHDNTLTQDNRDKFSELEKRYEQTIKFYNVDEICAEKIKRIDELFKNYPKYKRFTIGASYKLLISQVLSEDIEKIIYLDSDIIVNRDISEFWQINLTDKPLAAVSEHAFMNADESDEGENYFEEKMKAIFGLCEDGFVKPKDYFNNGVMLINLKQFRENEQENILAGVKFLSENFKYLCFDQEIFNWCFSKNYLKLPNEYNFSVIENRETGRFQVENRILHYLGKSLNSDMADVFNNLWFSYFEKTAWFTKDTLAHFEKGFKKIIQQKDISQKQITLKISALMSRKTRAFFVTAKILKLVKRVFLIKADEEIIPFVNQDSVQLLAESMKKSRGTKLFFILIEDYSQLCAALTKAGFIEWQDFIDASILIPDIKDVPLDTHLLIKAM